MEIINMFSFASRNTPTTAHINGQPTAVARDETILQAALRQGIDFPHSCRVGGCATCKCKLIEGKVKELTESTYILSDDDLDQGYILACQSVPLSDIRIEVVLSPQAVRHSVSGQIVGQEKLTHDITCLHIQLSEALPYQAGQFADISIASLPNVRRSYSFATPAQANAQVSFYIRKVPGGIFSTFINEQNVIGQTVTVDGPAGEFWLRPADAPLLLVAGGSGLAPILALLQEAAKAGVSRSTTLLFGAREEKDLYALNQIEEIQRQWRGKFRFIPVLSEVTAGNAWTGKMGLVTDQIPALLEDGAHAYLCGPPAMIDSAVAVVRQRGVPQEHLHADRFVTRQEVPGEVTANARHPVRTANLFHYLKYFLFHIIGLVSAVAIIAGGHYITEDLLAVLIFYVVGDAVFGDDTSTFNFRHPGILTAQLWLALPFLTLIVFAAVWSVSPGDPIGFGGWIAQLTGYDAIAARDATTFGHHVSTVILTGLLIGMVGTIPGHELTHRTWDPVSMFIGRWMLAFSFDTIFSIEHVYGHHRYVSTENDPATAPRGRNVYHHIVASTIKGNINAWKIEARRLARKDYGLFSIHNAFIRGHLMSVLLVAAAWGIGGPVGAGFFALCALWGKSLLEIVNYMEHYGMVRNPQTPVQPRHSWNTNKRISSWSMFNLTRHSHHHAQGEVPYQDLKPFPDAPMMINGYLTTIMVALIPPLWHALMTPKVLAWDRDYATQEEVELAVRANARSGIAGLRQAGAVKPAKANNGSLA
jgi:NAD(P)H-flavin reductase/ferredoxin